MKTRFIKKFLWSVLTYGCETWTLEKQQKSRPLTTDLVLEKDHVNKPESTTDE